MSCFFQTLCPSTIPLYPLPNFSFLLQSRFSALLVTVFGRGLYGPNGLRSLHLGAKTHILARKTPAILAQKTPTVFGAKDARVLVGNTASRLASLLSVGHSTVI
mmetsp:Transcript_32752/g.71904  ORF Transcript_32752/g.71904 Transcript_32752/m.71904 type:complete len:104 (+) Transcript_32752:400-711(+)